MHEAGENGGESEVWRRLGRSEKRELNVLRISSLAFRDGETGRSRCRGNAVRTSYFVFARQKRCRATSQNATKSGRAPYLLSVAVILLGTFACAERHSLNCRRERRRRWGIFEREAKKTYSFEFAV